MKACRNGHEVIYLSGLDSFLDSQEAPTKTVCVTDDRIHTASPTAFTDEDLDVRGKGFFYEQIISFSTVRVGPVKFPSVVMTAD
jgi:hypothetical protein